MHFALSIGAVHWPCVTFKSVSKHHIYTVNAYQAVEASRHTICTGPGKTMNKCEEKHGESGVDKHFMPAPVHIF